MVSKIKKMLFIALIAIMATNITAEFVPANTELDNTNAAQVCPGVCKAKGKKYLGTYISPDTNENLWVQLGEQYTSFAGSDFCACA
jgi:hypothetical protein